MNKPHDYTSHYAIAKAKGLYYPSQEKMYETCINKTRGITAMNAGCRINKRLPGTLGSPNAISRKAYESILLTGHGKGNTCARFVLNADENGQRQGQPGGIRPPIRNRF